MTRYGSPQDYDIDSPGEDAGRIRPGPEDWALLLLRAPSRRKLLFASVLVAALAAVAVFYKLATPIYRVEAKILAQQQQILPSGLRSGQEDNPAKTAWEVIHRRESVLSLIKTAKLLDEGPAKEGPGLLYRLGVLKVSEDPLDDMVALIDKRLQIMTEEGTITIQLDWPDPKQAYAIVDGALQNFIEARHVQEVTAIDEVMSVLRVRAAAAKDQLERVTADVRRESLEGYRREATDAGRDARPPPATVTAPASRAPSDELIRLRSLLEAKERAIGDVEEFRRRRLADLHAQLDEKRATFSDAHPSIIQLRQDIDALTKESPQVQALQEEAAKLRSEYQAKASRESSSSEAGSAQTTSVARTPQRTPRPSTTPVEDDERVRDARFQYQQIAERVNAAQFELDAVRAAFKYRYNVVWPPQIPREPRSPNPIKIFGVGIIAALLLAFLMSALPDLASGRIVERWQLERGLGITILAEIERK